jgi:hypothetical protein
VNRIAYNSKASHSKPGAAGFLKKAMRIPEKPSVATIEPPRPSQKTTMGPLGGIDVEKIVGKRGNTYEPIPSKSLGDVPVEKPEAEKPGSNFSEFIFEREVRKDKKGLPEVYRPPKNDGGGKEEIAGFTEKYNPEELALIKNTPKEKRKELILDLVDKKTQAAANWSKNEAVQGLMRDIVFHRGETGAQQIIKMALGGTGKKLTKEDIEALEQMDPADVIENITEARREYENKVVGVRSNLAKGLENRFNSARSYFLSQINQEGKTL